MGAISEAESSKLMEDLKIPPQPEILQAVQNELIQENPDIQLLSETIEQDGGLHSALLRLINSPYFDIHTEITSIPHALALIGLENLSSNVACIKLKSEFDKIGFSCQPRYWDKSYSSARLSCYIASQLKIASPHEAYVLGLFSDSGIPILSDKYPNYINILKLQNENDQPNYTDQEDRALHTNHCIVGYLLMMRWGMSQALQEACLYHHDIRYITDRHFQGDQKPRVLILIMKIAAYVLQKRRNETDFEWRKIREFIFYFLGMSEHDFDGLCLKFLDYLSERGL